MKSTSWHVVNGNRRSVLLLQNVLSPSDCALAPLTTYLPKQGRSLIAPKFGIVGYRIQLLAMKLVRAPANSCNLCGTQVKVGLNSPTRKSTAILELIIPLGVKLSSHHEARDRGRAQRRCWSRSPGCLAGSREGERGGGEPASAGNHAAAAAALNKDDVAEPKTERGNARTISADDDLIPILFSARPTGPPICLSLE